MLRWIMRQLRGEQTPSREAVPASAQNHDTAPSRDAERHTGRSPEEIDKLLVGQVLGVHSPLDRELNAVETCLIRALDKTAASLTETCALVPRIPAIIPQLMRTLRDENATNSLIAEQIAQDASLVGEIIRIANSPYYRAAVPTTSIEQAVRRLGQVGLKQLIATVAFRPIVNVQTGVFARTGAPIVWHLAEYCALSCRCLAKSEKLDPFEAFLAGLVHNIGSVVALTVMDRNYDGMDAPRSIEFHEAFDRLARRLSLQVVRGWDFPDSIVAAVADQVQPEQHTPSPGLGTTLITASHIAKVRILVDAGTLKDNPEHLKCGNRAHLAKRSMLCYQELARAAPDAG